MVQVNKKNSIVKVQLSLYEVKPRTVLVYNWDNSIYYEGEATKEIIKLMGKQDKIYCNSHYVGTQLMLDEVIDEQSW